MRDVGVGSDTVRRAMAGDTGAFTQLVRTYRNAAFGCAVSMLGDFQDAEDAVQDAFVQAFRSLPSLQNSDLFPAWMRAIVRSQCHRVLRKRRPGCLSIDMAGRAASTTPGPEDGIVRRHDEQCVMDALRSLPDSLREVVVFYYLNQASVSEVATFLQLTDTVVKNRLYRGRKALKRRLLPMMEETLRAKALDEAFAERVGRIVAVDGPVIDVQFDNDEAPMFACLAGADGSAPIQIVQRLDGGRVRAVVYSAKPAPVPGQELSLLPPGDVARIPAEGVEGLIGSIRSRGKAKQMIETGIKVIDLLCPLVAGGAVGLFGDAGAGKAAVIQEIVDRLEARNDSVSLIAFVDPGEAEALPRMRDPIPKRAGQAETAYLPVADRTVPVASLDTAICFSADMARAGRWPAIDAIASRSVFLDAGATDRHRRLADAARRLLADEGPPSRPRRNKLQGFLKQALFVAEPHSGVAGSYAPLSQTLDGVEEILG